LPDFVFLQKKKKLNRIVSVGRSGILFAFKCSRAKGRTVYTLLERSHSFINGSFQAMHVRNFV